MKKIVIGAFALAFASAVNAASISWSINNIYGPETNATAPTSYTAMLFVTANSTDVAGFTLTTLSAVTSAIGNDGWATTVGDLASVTKGLNATGVMGGATGLSSSFSSGSLSAFAVIFDTTTAGDLSTADHYYLVNEGATQTATFTSGSGTKFLGFGSQETNSKLAVGTAGGWTAVPEPTTGLLLLLGMAGLAMKRKVA